MKPIETVPLAEIVRRSLDEGQQPYFQITSDSMSPLIRKGDDVQISHQGVDQMTVGDIVVVADDTGLLTHRLWLVYSIHGIPHVLLRGDRLQAYDLPYQASQIIGQVIARRRGHQMLDLTGGIGRVLNSWLFRFASVANPPPSSPHGVQTSILVPASSELTSNSLLLRIRNRLLFVVATALTFMVDLANRK